MDGCRQNNAGAIVEHAIRDARDYEHHMDYIHNNPVKHAWVDNVIDWPFSSFHRYYKSGLYSVDWSVVDDNDSVMGER